MPRVADITSPHHTNGSSRGTPRTSTSQTWQGGYPTPQRSNTAPASNLYNVMEPRDGQNGGAPDYYQSAPFTNGAVPSNKRSREDDDADDDVKRAKTEHEEGGPVGGSSPYAINSARGAVPRKR
jgi:hypothetical protein